MEGCDGVIQHLDPDRQHLPARLLGRAGGCSAARPAPLAAPEGAVVPLGAPGHAALPGHAGPRITLPAWRTGRAARITFLQFAQDGQDAQRVSLSFSSPRMDTEQLRGGECHKDPPVTSLA